jgi:hypothetical protein
MVDSIPADLSLVQATNELHEMASGVTGLQDFGDDEYREGLDALLDSLDEEADLSRVGRETAIGLVVTALAGRLESEAGWKDHPSSGTFSIEAPIVIVGLPRTGTSVLHKMLASVDSLQGPELWLLQHPMPRPNRETWPSLAAYRQCEDALRLQQENSPDMIEIHDQRADDPDECWNLLRQSFASVTFECVFRVPSYSAWWAERDMTLAYRRWANNLRLIGANDRDRRWILKDPSHLFAPDALLAAVPDATIVMTHRDPARLIPSVCSLSATARRVNDRNPDMQRLGREQLDLWARGIERLMRTRERQPDRFVDIHFHEFLADPVAVAEKILEHAGVAYTDLDRERVLTWLDSRPSKPHRYDAEQFGLQDDQIRERFESYIDYFDVRSEA